MTTSSSQIVIGEKKEFPFCKVRHINLAEVVKTKGVGSKIVIVQCCSEMHLMQPYVGNLGYTLLRARPFRTATHFPFDFTCFVLGS